MPDPFDLKRFADAQHGIYEQALQELKAGHKRSHWMWFIFPQLAGLGSSAMAERYAIGSLDEARAYLQHPVLGQRLQACTAAVSAVAGRTAHQVFGTPDDMKFRSSMTLFTQADPEQPAFRQAMERYCGGAQDRRTLALLALI
ncbi:DUF1810 domain-containing protein [Methylobacterium brachiatum]|uniref:DUF1810 domain-containing protein n=1 Tax=Methylobacterium brachiatum TaxID=269660 RepID=UPI0024493C41|nr:DUF1810 domain-containing protein [Methylobacterium brachiatum]MDH2313884.1 DUF1810 domain-containing protein [Methylobacterium brachiatum]